jgi:glycosyltransferase involved in cell wall biosynthesis
LHFYRRDLRDARALIEKNRIPDDRKIALFVARFSPEKGVQYLIDVINKKLDGWHFIVVGDGPLSHYFEVLTSENSKSITRIKSVENSILPLYYSCADILIFGPADKDYLGRTAIECLSCGTPVLIYNQSTYFGQPEELSISENIESGILVVNSPLENCEKVLCSIKDESISFNTFLIRSAAVKSYSDSNGDCFL